MITIPEAVRDIIATEPFLEEALSRGIINTSALARSLRPEIEKRLYKNVQTGAIVMALKRLEHETSRKTGFAPLLLKNPDIIVRSNLVEYTLANSETVIHAIRKMLERNPQSKRHFLTFTQGVFETAVITSGEWIGEVEKIMAHEEVRGKQEGLSSLTIILPEENVVTPGVYYYLLRTLAWENINVIDVVSTKEEFTIILEGKDIDRAFTALKKSLP